MTTADEDLRETTARLVGRRVARREDPQLVTGSARYVDDLPLPGALHLRLVRSPFAHARLGDLDVPPIEPPAVVLTAKDLGSPPPVLHAQYRPRGQVVPPRPLLAFDRVRFVGEPYAAVLAADPYEAEDLADLVSCDFDELVPVVDPLDVPAHGTPLHDEFPDDVIFAQERSAGDIDHARRAAAHLVRRKLRVDRHTGVPLEPRGCAAVLDGGTIRLWASTQLPHLVRATIARTLGWDESRVEVICPSVGGGFGIKGHVYPEEVLVALLAARVGRPVKWIEDRAENLLAGVHARDHIYDIELALASDGAILGLAVDLVVDVGAYPVLPQTAALEVQMAGKILPGPYVVPNYSYRGRAVSTNKSPFGTYRGVARPGCAFALERMLDEAARELAVDPYEIRLRNVVRDFPYDTGTELTYDSGNFARSIELVRRSLADEHDRDGGGSGRRVGVGIACFVEQTAHIPPWAEPDAGVVDGPDRVRVTVDVAGAVTVLSGLNSHGQSHATTLAQVVADELGVGLDVVDVVAGDTSLVPYSMGTLASRAAVVGGLTAQRAARALAGRLRDVAARRWSVRPEEVELRGGRASLPDGRAARLGDVVGWAADDTSSPVLSEESAYDGPAQGTFSGACHGAVVAVDTETGQVRVTRYVVAEDCGQMLNPTVVEGQVHGGVAQGLGGALFERLVYDDHGQLVTTTLMDYPLPSSVEVPDIEIHHVSTPGYGPAGAKGVGEGGAIGVMAAVANAVADALGPELAASVTHVPLTPLRVWEIVQGREP